MRKRSSLYWAQAFSRKETFTCSAGAGTQFWRMAVASSSVSVDILTGTSNVLERPEKKTLNFSYIPGSLSSIWRSKMNKAIAKESHVRPSSIIWQKIERPRYLVAVFGLGISPSTWRLTFHQAIRRAPIFPKTPCIQNSGSPSDAETAALGLQCKWLLS
jgi:hypothetical protein